MSDKTSILIPCSQKLKDALGEYASDHKVSMSLVVREAVARYINYPLELEEVVDGRRKYKSKEARSEANNNQRREERANLARLMELLKTQQHNETIKILRDSLIAKGIDPDA